MKKIFAIIVICSLIYACKPGIPENVIQPDKMEKVLFDIHIVDGYIGSLPRPDTAKIVASSYYKGIYKKFNIDSATYTNSLNYYYTRPDVLNKMYENIMKQLDDARKKNDKRLELEAQETQRKNLAKHAKVLDVSQLPTGPPTFSLSYNPFTFTLPQVQ